MRRSRRPEKTNKFTGKLVEFIPATFALTNLETIRRSMHEFKLYPNPSNGIVTINTNFFLIILLT